MGKLIATLALAGVFGVILATARKRDDLLPNQARVGANISAPFARLADSSRDLEKRAIDVIFVAKDCGACRSLVDRLTRIKGVPTPGNRVVFVTDQVWPGLASLGGERTRIIAHDTALARSVRVRATPTLVAFNPRSRHISFVAVGIDAVADRFVPGPGE